MSWERRGNGGRFYYRACRVGDRVIKQYFGSGEAAEKAAAEDAARRTQRAQQRDEQAARAALWQEQFAILDRQERVVDVFVAATLLTSSWKNHCGSWRAPAREYRRQDA